MDPAIANQDFDPPAQPPLVGRALLPALAVNAVFIAALAWSVPWHRTASTEAATKPATELATMGGPPVAEPPTSQPAPAIALPVPGSQPQAAAPRTTPRPPVVASITPAERTSRGPSFDCAKARSRTEKLICADAELAQLDREMGRLNVRARALSPDPVAFRRAGDLEWKRREAECRDKACLLAWYAQRREHLQAVVDRGG
jgi:hypothetical protein